MDVVICKYGEGDNKVSNEMDVDALSLEEDTKKSNIENNIYSVSTEDANKGRSKNTEELCTVDDSKYKSIENSPNASSCL